MSITHTNNNNSVRSINTIASVFDRWFANYKKLASKTNDLWPRRILLPSPAAAS